MDKTYFFTEQELRQLLIDTICFYYEQEGVFDFSNTAQVETVMHMMTTLPKPPEDEIPFNGEPVVYENEDNITRFELGL